MFETAHCGSIFKSDVEALVNPVNCLGVMGAGLALKFKDRFYQNYQAYRTACHKKLVVPGKVFCFEMAVSVKPRYIINFPTKVHWRDPSTLEYIELGLEDLRRTIIDKNIESIAIPALGCGLGQLSWKDVSAMIVSRLEEVTSLRVILFPPQEKAMLNG